MPTSPLEVNFFTVAFPEKPLPFLLRERGNEEKLRRGEMNWTNEDAEATKSRRSVLLTDNYPNGYIKEEHNTDVVGPTIVKRLLELGLLQTFQKRNYISYSDKFSISVFRPDELVRTSADFLTVRKGVECVVDHVTYAGPRQYGFFIVPTTRQEFSNSLSDPDLAKAALNHKVQFLSSTNQHVRARLVGVDGRQQRVTVETADGTQELSVDDVVVPGSREIVDAYCTLLGKKKLIKDVRDKVRTASFRYNSNGQKNVRWLRDQIEYVCGWLLMASHNGRVPLTWPRSSIHLSLSSKPSVAYERRRT